MGPKHWDFLKLLVLSSCAVKIKNHNSNTACMQKEQVYMYKHSANKKELLEIKYVLAELKYSIEGLED